MADEMALLVADIFEAAGLLRRSGEATASRTGQTQARWQLLSVLSGTALTVPQAARRLGVARQGVQRLANDLVAEGLLAAAPNPDHRTSSLLAPTGRGREVLDEINRGGAVQNRRLEQALGEATVATTRDCIRRLIAALNDAPG